MENGRNKFCKPMFCLQRTAAILVIAIPRPDLLVICYLFKLGISSVSCELIEHTVIFPQEFY